jgi:hypothetical protein
MSKREAQAVTVWEELRQQRGSVTRIACALRIKPQAVHMWQQIPLHRVLQVAALTDRPWRSLRPDKAHLTDAFLRRFTAERTQELLGGRSISKRLNHNRIPARKSSHVEKQKRRFVNQTKEVRDAKQGC